MRANFNLFLAILGIAVAVFALIKGQNTNKELLALQRKIQEQEEASEKSGQHEELAEYMHRLQWYTNKLYFAGKAGNLELAAFYAHEVEEVMEEVAGSGIIDEGKNISELMETYGEAQIKRFDQFLDRGDLSDFDNQYLSLIEACNSCHVVAEHAFIKIQIPLSPVIDNQVYNP